MNLAIPNTSVKHLHRIIRRALLAGAAFGALGLRSPAQDVFREFTFAYGKSPKTQFAELDPDTKRSFTLATIPTVARCFSPRPAVALRF